jgi:hypothetical protein
VTTPTSTPTGEITDIGPPAEPTAPAMGLLAAEPPRSGVGHWEDGVAWQPTTGATWDLFSPCEETEEGELPALRELVPVIPVGYRVRDRSRGRRGIDLDPGLARRQAEAMTSFALARELWTGEGSARAPRTLPGWLGGTEGYVNPHLADAAHCAVVGGTHSAVEGLGLLEGAAYEELGGQGVPVLHIPIRVLLAVAEKLTQRGSVLYTAAGTPVVADGGYPGTGPGGAAGTWAYATGPVLTLVGEITSDTDASSTFLYRQNVREVYAARMIAAGFDPGCHLGVALDIPVPSVTRPGGTS